ncbi:FadR family transcriptional regulator [Actinospica durhamensis]|uniref:FadR family transcriptional regulator n=1 Tax=Actinospica durhamensis TaxID=1508375 RepID=A0A941IRG7_9ACTN|nr:FadR/GntR family transcriptional regulator [Actinospica durhamensis]MBR7835287.1 FadR family transcriptional regulator [Actinospica durhamensis]
MTELAGLRRGSLGDEVIATLREQITSGAWPVGERIPAESELIERLQVGRGTVREAIKALAHVGLLEVRQGDGTYVKSRSELAGALRRQMGSYRNTHVQEVRRALEVEAARLAASRRTDEDLRAMADALAERDLAADTGRALGRWDPVWGTPWVEADVRFHQAVVAASHNPMLTEMYLEMAEQLSTVLTAISSATDHEPYLVRGHRALLEAIEAGDTERAALEALHNVETPVE